MRQSRRWLLASMGASAVAAAGAATLMASDTERVLPVRVDCEKDYAQDVGLKTWSKVPSDAAGAEDKLFEVIVYGFGYKYDGTHGPLPDFTKALGSHLVDAYENELPNLFPNLPVSKWQLLVAQAFILGQLVRFFWTYRPDSQKFLKPRHLTAAWAVFGRATSSCFCAEWVVGPAGSKNAYYLPQLLKIRETDQPCALCN